MPPKKPKKPSGVPRGTRHDKPKQHEEWKVSMSCRKVLFIPSRWTHSTHQETEPSSSANESTMGKASKLKPSAASKASAGKKATAKAPAAPKADKDAKSSLEQDDTFAESSKTATPKRPFAAKDGELAESIIHSVEKRRRMDGKMQSDDSAMFDRGGESQHKVTKNVRIPSSQKYFSITATDHC
jgi:hypothetical protein